MKYCSNCGNQVNENQDVCLNCGVSLKPKVTQKYEKEGPTGGWALLGFFFPLIGLILYLLWTDVRPNAAKSAGKGALIGVITGVIVSVIAVILVMVLMMQMYTVFIV